MRSWFAVLLLSSACWLLTGAADFYARVPPKSNVYTDLGVLSRSGYLGSWKKPNYNLLRLEVALLLQTALPEYQRSGFEPGAKPELEAAIDRLTTNFQAELLELGVQGPDTDAGFADDPGGMPVELLGVKPPRPVQIDDEVLTDKASRAKPGMVKPAPKPARRHPETPADVTLTDGRDVTPKPPARVPQPAPTAADLPAVAADRPVPAVADREPEAALPSPADDEPAFDSLSSAIPATPDPPRSEPPTRAIKLDELTPVPALAPQPEPVPEPVPVPTAPKPLGALPSSSPERREINLIEYREQAQASASAQAENDSPGLGGFVKVPPSYVATAAPRPSQRYARELALNVEPFADIQGQGTAQRSAGPGGVSSFDARLYWADAGLRFNADDWGGQATLNYNDRTGSAKLHQLWVEARSEQGGFARAGRTVLPFAERKGWFPTFSVARELGFTTANAAGIGWDQPNWGLSAWVYDPPADKAGGGSGDLEDFALNMQLCNLCREDDATGWRLALAVLSELRGHEAKLAGSGAGGRAPAYNVSGGWTFDHGRFELNADYTAALRRYSPGALDADGDGVGDRPGALAIELLHTPEGLAFYGLRYEYSSQFADRPATRWSALYGQWLSEDVLGRVEMSRSSYNAYTPGRRHDLRLTADLNLVF